MKTTLEKWEKRVDIQQKATLIAWSRGDWSLVIMGFNTVIALEDKRGLILNVLINRIKQWNGRGGGWRYKKKAFLK